VGPHATGGVGLDHRVDTRRFQGAFSHISLWSATECSNDNQLPFIHVIDLNGRRTRPGNANTHI
jgi:hypothetical protein